MVRDINKAIEEHYRYMKNHKGNGDFYASDIEQVLKRATRADGSIDTINAIGDAFYAGFSVGYRIAKREARGEH